MSAAIGLDIGHSAVKVAVSDSKGKRHFLTIPTAVCQAIKISYEAEAERAAKETVKVGSIDYFIGDTALVQGGPMSPVACLRIGSVRPSILLL